MLNLLAPLFAMVEAIIHVGRMVFTKDKEFEPVHIAVFLLGGFATWFFGLDVFVLFEVVPAVEISWLVLLVNTLLGGVIFVRYAGALHDLLKKLEK